MKINQTLVMRLGFAVLIAVSISLIVFRAYHDDWSTVVATISLIIAVVSAWLAYETFHNQYLNSKPQLTVQPNFEERNGLILITLKNHGEKPAYNITIDWHLPIINSKEEKFSFSKGAKEYDILVLDKNEKISTLLDGVVSFYEKYKDADLEYSGIISYSESLYSPKRTNQKFIFSLTSYKRLSIETDLGLTHNKLQSIPESLNKIHREISNLRKELTQIQ
ncbi:hypothetical protein [Pontibacter ruber]|uniref:DUF58 domain-containing protein n=1 Tax=Pontibacter ruber TaxID=1343895 RepID=A0ABW5CZ48_9BACT|nr:hypothetical protein [Pontibacter ruber]